MQIVVVFFFLVTVVGIIWFLGSLARAVALVAGPGARRQGSTDRDLLKQEPQTHRGENQTN